MDAIDYLTDQHHEIASLFDQIEHALRMTTKLRLCRKLLDLLAVHAAIEETIFYPAAQEAGLEELFPSAFEGHLLVERIIAELVRLGGVRAEAPARLAVLKAMKRHHAEEEEEELFPRVRQLLTPGRLARLGEQLASAADKLMGPGVGARERIAARRVLA